MRHRLAPVAAAALLLAVPASARPAAPALTASQTQVDTLLGILFPIDRLLQLNLAAWQEELAATFDADPALVAREKAAPGLRARVIEAGLAEVRDAYGGELPVMARELRPIYAELTPADADTLIAFFRTPTGAKLVAQMHAGVAQSASLTVRGVADDGRRKALASLEPSDVPALKAFAATPASARARAMAPRIAEVSDRHITAVTKRLETAVPAARARALATPSTRTTDQKASGQ
ncbi:DUF2059 domain-containing protein [Sphingomonas jatrophae]|uniref:DUF2059 domain-containing protein n=1 Tax=Sphingomonas jatrophae TaxID=1166337 RepID=A0A1I6L2Z6_9SPHN|nr:DUF2059 domain-containing protein [Sphingomonas jatrophae]SFR97825.1 hypothetical protein SAMN05192580_2212 [Sphingomonas jatrophae]